ncbi:MAG: amidohydrolase [Verrucomicrobiia bacterium]
MRIDAHQHFWQYDATQYPWIQPTWPIRKSFLPPKLEPVLRQAQIDGSIAVQARQSLEETHWLLELADQYPLVAGVVGWVDLRSPDVADQLASLAQRRKLVGVRHVVQDEPDDRFLLDAAFVRGLGELRAFKLVYDLLVYPRQLPAAIELVEKLPDQRFVLDHIAKPPIREGRLEPWRQDLRLLAQAPNVFCKVSGMVTEADWTRWKPEDFRPYLDVVFEAFGTDRVMFGSDWPVCLLAADYSRVLKLVTDYVNRLTIADQERFFGGTAALCYLLA